MTELPLELKKIKANCRGCFGLSRLFFFLLFLDFDRRVLVILGLRILLRKKITHALAYNGLHAIQVARESPCNNQNLAFTVALGAACRPFSDGEARAHGGGPVRLRWRFFLSSLFSLSFPRESHLNFQKNNCVIRFVILSILVLLLLLITVYLVFEPF
jgi:hypothetical protein